MAEESPPLPPSEESIEAETDTALEPGPKSGEPTPEPTREPGFVCGCDARMHSACRGLPFYKKHKSKRFCILHLPTKKNPWQFAEAIRQKVEAKDFDFQGVWFPDEIKFRGVELTNADFWAAKFNAKADFSYAVFDEEADFLDVVFNAEVIFFDARFMKGADFEEAIFGAGADFRDIGFTRTLDFSEATFKSYVKFEGSNKNRELPGQSSLDFQHARIEHPDLISFHTIPLRPHWFVNVDSQKFVFTDVKWDLDARTFDEETARLTKKHVSSPHRLVAISFRQLAENAEANNHYEQASRFRYWAMDLARLDKWRGVAFWKTDWLHVLYWAVSGYGERIWLAFLWLIAVYIVFALLYTHVGFTQPESKFETPNAAPVTEPDTIGQPLSLKRGWLYSLGVMSLQKPEPKPLTGTAQTLVLLETILGPVQAALLALAIRRKFMR
jgi:hypothetical protein